MGRLFFYEESIYENSKPYFKIQIAITRQNAKGNNSNKNKKHFFKYFHQVIY